MTRGTKKAEVQPKSAHADVAPAVPLPEVLSFLKDTRGATTWTTKDMADCLEINVRDGRRVLSVMEMQGYVKETESAGEWLTTPAGEVVAGSKPPRFTPKCWWEATPKTFK